MRQCSYTGKFFTEGYCINGGEQYAIDDNALRSITGLSVEQAYSEDTYFSEWNEITSIPNEKPITTAEQASTFFTALFDCIGKCRDKYEVIKKVSESAESIDDIQNLIEHLDNATRLLPDYFESDYYVKVTWPDIQDLMQEEWFNEEAILDVNSSSDYFVPLARLTDNK